MYPRELELKMVCQSPDTIVYLDIEIRHDRGGFHTIMYDKRDALQAQGKMSAVRRFPHVESALSEQCRYGCLTSFLHRARRTNLRVRAFISAAATRSSMVSICFITVSHTHLTLPTIYPV